MYGQSRYLQISTGELRHNGKFSNLHQVVTKTLSTHSNHLTWKGLSSLQNFVINQPRDRMPDSVIRAYGILKGAAAAVNVRHGALGKPCLALLRLASDTLVLSCPSEDEDI